MAIAPLSFTERGAEVEEWGWGRRKQHCAADQGQAKDWQAGPCLVEGTLLLKLDRKRQSEGQGHSFVMVQRTPGKTVK